MTETWISSSTPYLRPRPAGAPDAWTDETAGRGTQRLTEVASVVPPHTVGTALRLAEGEPAIVRRRVVLLDDEAVELADSYYPTRIAAGTQLAERTKIRGGATTLLASLGYHARHVIEDVESRGASAEEAAALRANLGQPVLVLLRTSLAETGAPIEASLMVMKGPRLLRYETKVC